MSGLEPSPASNEVECGIVRDAKDPPFWVFDGACGRKRFNRLDHRILKNVFAVDDRAGHPRAIAMELRPKLGEQAIECCRVERRRGLRNVRSSRSHAGLKLSLAHPVLSTAVSRLFLQGPLQTYPSKTSPGVRRIRGRQENLAAPPESFAT